MTGAKPRKMSTTRARKRCRSSTTRINTSVEEELIASLEDLAEDQQAELLAFAWVGQGTYDAADWDEAIEEAAAARKTMSSRS